MSATASAQGTPKLDFVKHIYDSVHGYVGVTELERSIIDTPIFQRLRRVKQLSPVDLVYPGATHTRFAHSIGSLFVMDKIANRLVDDHYLEEEDVQRLRLAALLHDLGHYPFSHVIESVMCKRYGDRGKHEAMSVHLIRNSIIGATLRKYEQDPEETAATIERRSRNPIFNYLLSSDLDVDRIDYLLRDAYHTGVAYGFIDIDRLIRTISVNEQTSAQLAVLEKGRQAVENFLIGRYHMYQSVYYHKTVVAFALMLEKIYDEMLEEGCSGCPDLESIKAMSEKDMARFDDSSVWREICHYDGRSGFLRELIDMLCKRVSLKVAYEEPSLAKVRANTSIWKVLLVPLQRKTLSQVSKIEEDWIFLSEPPLIDLIISSEPETAIYIKKGEDYLRLVEDDTSIVHHLVDFRYLTPRVYTKEEYMERLRNGLRSCFGLSV